MDPIAQRLARFKWAYAEQDLSALTEIAQRVATVGRAKDLVTYSRLVQGIAFRLRTVNGGEPLNLGVPEWLDLHRAILGDFLGRLCLETYERGKFMGSAIVVSARGLEPSDGFRELMRQLGLLHGRSQNEFLVFWSGEVRKAHSWYAEHDW